MLTLLLLSLTTSGPVYRGADGGVRAIDVERAAILFPGSGLEADRVVHVDGGTWVSTEQRIREGQENADLIAQNKYLQDHAADVPTAWLGVAAAGGAVAAVIATIATLAATGHLR